MIFIFNVRFSNLSNPIFRYLFSTSIYIFFLKSTWIRYTKQVDAEEERAKEKGIGWKTVTRSLSDYSLVQDACWYFVTYLCSSLLDYHVRTARSEGHTRFFPFVRSFVPLKKKFALCFSLSFFLCFSVCQASITRYAILTLASNILFRTSSFEKEGGRKISVIQIENGER